MHSVDITFTECTIRYRSFVFVLHHPSRPALSLNATVCVGARCKSRAPAQPRHGADKCVQQSSSAYRGPCRRVACTLLVAEAVTLVTLDELAQIRILIAISVQILSRSADIPVTTLDRHT